MKIELEALKGERRTVAESKHQIELLCCAPSKGSSLCAVTSLISDWMDASNSDVSAGRGCFREEAEEKRAACGGWERGCASEESQQGGQSAGTVFFVGTTNEREKIHPRLLLPTRLGSLLVFIFFAAIF